MGMIVTAYENSLTRHFHSYILRFNYEKSNHNNDNRKRVLVAKWCEGDLGVQYSNERG
jgi:hypothetical protein